MTAPASCNGLRGCVAPDSASTYTSEPFWDARALTGDLAAILAAAAVSVLIFGSSSRRRRQAAADAAEVAPNVVYADSMLSWYHLHGVLTSTHKVSHENDVLACLPE